jgi:site-specific recombinase XerC
LSNITTESMQVAFAQYPETHSAASILRCWSTWNVICTYLFTSELLAANPMPHVGRPRVPKSLPKALPPNAVASLLSTLCAEPERRSSDWIERDRALILTALLAGLRSDELVRANVGDIRTAADGAVVQVRGKGEKDRRIPVEGPLMVVLTDYLNSRAARFPATTKKRSPTGGLAAWPASVPLFVGANGERITRGTLQYRVPRAFQRAGIDSDRARGTSRSRSTAYLRYRARELRGRCLYPDESAGPRIYGYLPALRQRCWQPDETGCRLKPVVRAT